MPSKKQATCCRILLVSCMACFLMGAINSSKNIVFNLPVAPTDHLILSHVSDKTQGLV
jgi:hypothetical protein